jgi:hypothetical protein
MLLYSTRVITKTNCSVQSYRNGPDQARVNYQSLCDSADRYGWRVELRDGHDRLIAEYEPK